MLGDLNRPLYEVKAGLFKGLAHPIRIRILEVLSEVEEASVTEILNVVELEASHVSQHLAVLRRNSLVSSERRGSLVYYRLSSSRVSELLAVSRALLTEILHRTQHQLNSGGNVDEETQQ